MESCRPAFQIQVSEKSRRARPRVSPFARSSSGDVSANVGSSIREPQKVHAFELSKQYRRDIRREIPEALDLGFGERQARHLDVFGTNQIHASARCDVSSEAFDVMRVF